MALSPASYARQPVKWGNEALANAGGTTATARPGDTIENIEYSSISFPEPFPWNTVKNLIWGKRNAGSAKNPMEIEYFIGNRMPYRANSSLQSIDAAGLKYQLPLQGTRDATANNPLALQLYHGGKDYIEPGSSGAGTNVRWEREKVCNNCPTPTSLTGANILPLLLIGGVVAVFFYWWK